MFSHSSCLGEASAGRVGPLARGTFDCLSRDPALPGAPSSRRRGVGREAPLQEPRRARPAALLAAAFRGPAGRAPSALYTESGRTPPASLMPPTLHDARAFSTALERGFHGGRGPGLCFLHIPAGPDPSAATGPCPSHPVFRVTSEQTSMWLVWGWENFTNIRT